MPFFDGENPGFSEACNLIKKETLVQVFSCHFCKITQNTFFTEHFRATASGWIDHFKNKGNEDFIFFPRAVSELPLEDLQLANLMQCPNQVTYLVKWICFKKFVVQSMRD